MASVNGDPTPETPSFEAVLEALSPFSDSGAAPEGAKELVQAVQSAAPSFVMQGLQLPPVVARLSACASTWVRAVLWRGLRRCLAGCRLQPERVYALFSALLSSTADVKVVTALVCALDGGGEKAEQDECLSLVHNLFIAYSSHFTEAGLEEPLTAAPAAGPDAPRASSAAAVRRLSEQSTAADVGRLPRDIFLSSALVSALLSAAGSNGSRIRWQAVDIVMVVAAIAPGEVVAGGGVQTLLEAAVEGDEAPAPTVAGAAMTVCSLLADPLARRNLGVAVSAALSPILSPFMVEAIGFEKEKDSESLQEHKAEQVVLSSLRRCAAVLVVLARTWPGLIALSAPRTGFRGSAAKFESVLAMLCSSLDSTHSAVVIEALLAMFCDLLLLPPLPSLQPPDHAPFSAARLSALSVSSRSTSVSSSSGASGGGGSQRRPPVTAPKSLAKGVYLAAVVKALGVANLPRALYRVATLSRGADPRLLAAAALLLAEMGQLMTLLQPPPASSSLQAFKNLITSAITPPPIVPPKVREVDFPETDAAIRLVGALHHYGMQAGSVPAGASMHDDGPRAGSRSMVPMTAVLEAISNDPLSDVAAGQGSPTRSPAGSAGSRTWSVSTSSEPDSPQTRDTRGSLSSAIGLSRFSQHRESMASSTFREEDLLAMVKQTGVLEFRSLEWERWDFAAISEIVRGPMSVRGVVPRLSKLRFMKRLAAFFTKRAPTIRPGTEKADWAGLVGMEFVGALLCTQEGQDFLASGSSASKKGGNEECTLLADVALALSLECNPVEVEDGGTLKGRLFHPLAVSETIAPLLLDMVGALSASTTGVLLLDKFGVTAAMKKVLSERGRTDLHQLLLSCLDYRMAGGSPRAIFEAAVAAQSSTLRLFALYLASRLLTRCLNASQSDAAASTAYTSLQNLSTEVPEPLSPASPHSPSAVSSPTKRDGTSGSILMHAMSMVKSPEDAVVPGPPAWVPDTARWLIKVLLERLKGAPQTEAEVISSILGAALTHPFPAAVEVMDEQQVTVAQLSAAGPELCLQFLGTATGFRFLRASAWLQQELAHWDSGQGLLEYTVAANRLMAEQVADVHPLEATCAGGTHGRRMSSFSFSRSTRSSRGSVASLDTPVGALVHSMRSAHEAEKSLPPHLYGALARTAEGCELLEAAPGRVQRLVECLESTAARALHHRAAAWALGSIAGASIQGFTLVDKVGGIDSLLQGAQGAANLAVRGTCMYALSLAAECPLMKQMLTEHEWVGKVVERAGAGYTLALPRDYSGHVFRLPSDHLLRVVRTWRSRFRRKSTRLRGAHLPAMSMQGKKALDVAKANILHKLADDEREVVDQMIVSICKLCNNVPGVMNDGKNELVALANQHRTLFEQRCHELRVVAVSSLTYMSFGAPQRRLIWKVLGPHPSPIKP